MLGRWVAAERARMDDPREALDADERAELERLRRENAALRMDRELLARSYDLLGVVFCRFVGVGWLLPGCGWWGSVYLLLVRGMVAPSPPPRRRVPSVICRPGVRGCLSRAPGRA